MLLLALWLPVTMHCTLETLPVFGFLQCCCGGDEAQQAPSDCRDDVCGEVEAGFYKIEDNPTAPPGLALHLALVAWNTIEGPLADYEPAFTPASLAPTELSRSWQFSVRTALPPRAPSPVA